MINGINLLAEDNPRPSSGNPAETIKPLAVAPGQLTAPCSKRSRLLLLAWLTSLPHRVSTWFYRPNDTEAGWWHWQITERRGGFARSYRDVRFDVLRQLHELTTRRGEPEGPSVALCPVVPTGAGLAAVRTYRRQPARAKPWDARTDRGSCCL